MKFKQTEHGCGFAGFALIPNNHFLFCIFHFFYTVRRLILKFYTKICKLDYMNENKLKILLVEDNQENREVVSFFIRGMGQLDFAVNGNEALQKAREDFFDIILMDINLGFGINGIEVTKQLRQTPRYLNTPIVAVTAYVMKGDKTIFDDAGCSHFIGKPFTRKELRDLLSKIIFDYRLSEKIQ